VQGCNRRNAAHCAQTGHHNPSYLGQPSLDQPCLACHASYNLPHVLTAATNGDALTAAGMSPITSSKSSYGLVAPYAYADLVCLLESCLQPGQLSTVAVVSLVIPRPPLQHVG